MASDVQGRCTQCGTIYTLIYDPKLRELERERDEARETAEYWKKQAMESARYAEKCNDDNHEKALLLTKRFSRIEDLKALCREFRKLARDEAMSDKGFRRHVRAEVGVVLKEDDDGE